MSKGVDYPEPPNPLVTTGLDFAANLGTGITNSLLNQYNTQTPYGSVSLEGSPIGGLWGRPPTQVTQLTPQGQNLLNQQLAISDEAQDLGWLRLGQLGADQFGYEDPTARAQSIEDATFDRYMRLLEPQMERQYTRTQTDLANRGLPTGQEAYNDAMDQLSRSQNEQLLNVADAATLAGSREMERLFREDLATRQQQYAELAQILGQAGVPGAPNAAPPAAVGIQPPNPGQALMDQYAGQVGAANAQQAANSSMLGGLTNLGGAWLLGGTPLPF